MNKLKCKPAYYTDLLRRSKQYLIFLAVDPLSVHIIRRLKGVCLLCDQTADNYDLSFCIGREVWVLYAHFPCFTAAMQLARTVQWMGATKVSVIHINTALAEEIKHDQLFF